MRKIGLWLTAGALVLYPVQAPGQTTPLPVAVPSPAQPGRVQVPALPRSPEASPPPPAGGREPSLYLRCDGHPNNMTGLEAFTRLVALSFVVGLMAPAPENDDPDKRLFGTAGVAACTTLLDDPTRHEGNGLRRIPLVLARAVHNIEAKNYTAAIVDVDGARAEARALGLIGNPYFDRSMGLSFNLLESEARLRMGEPEKAREAGLRDVLAMPASFYPRIAARLWEVHNPEMTAEENRGWESRTRGSITNVWAHASRLADVGRFADAADLAEAMVVASDAVNSKVRNPDALAAVALYEALASRWDLAARHAVEAQVATDAADAAGTPNPQRPRVIEMLDLFRLLQLDHAGQSAEARAGFAARSQWTAPAPGLVIGATARLRAGARPEELIGALAKTPGQLRDERRRLIDARRGVLDGNNRTLFSFILPYAKIGDFEGLSKNVWRTDKSRIMATTPIVDSQFYSLSIVGEPMTQPDALMLHAALMARARGASHFIFWQQPTAVTHALVQFGKPGDAGFADRLALEADTVIADLRQIIPSPAELEARHKAAAK